MEAPDRKQCPAQTVIAIEHRGSHDDIGGVYRQLMEWAKTKGVGVTGPGLTIFLSPPEQFDPQSGVFEVCMPVAAAPEADGEVKVKELPACTVACTTVTGPYSEIPAHYTEMLAWLSMEGLEIAGPPREVYIKHPGSVCCDKELVTEIQFPVR